MAANEDPKGPSRPTVKRLFAVSGNLCAFPKCSTPLVDPVSGSIIGEICHIKGEKPGAARYDATQPGEERHGFDNLVLLCGVHHKVVDDDVKSYTVERLLQIKQQHETRHAGPPPVDEATAEQFVAVAVTNSVVHGPVIASHGQSGGQTAQTINNYYGSPAAEQPTQLEAKLEMAGDLEVIRATGCAGLRLSVVCRSLRAAKIQSAHLLIDGVDVVGGLEKGFGANLGYSPVPGSTQIMDVMLIALSPPNSHEGWVLNRDDVARFFYPLPFPSTPLALGAKPENVSITVKHFDDSEETVLKGEAVRGPLQDLLHMYQRKPGQLNVPIHMTLRVKSTTPLGPEVADLVGKVNPNYVPMTMCGDQRFSAKPGGGKS